MANTRQDHRSPPSSGRCCSIPVLKFGVAVYNILLLACGGCLVGVSCWSIAAKHAHTALLTSSAYSSVACMLLIAGLVSIIGGIMGCMALAKEDRCTLVMFIFLVVLVFVLEAVAGVVAYVYEEQLERLLTESLPSSISEHYYVDDDVTAAVDSMQEQFHCCGALSYTEWADSNWKTYSADQRTVPDSCCKTVTLGCGVRDHPSNIWYTGCIYGLSSSMGTHLLLLGALGCGLSLLQVLGVVMACGLYVTLGKTI